MSLLRRSFRSAAFFMAWLVVSSLVKKRKNFLSSFELHPGSSALLFSCLRNLHLVAPSSDSSFGSTSSSFLGLGMGKGARTRLCSHFHANTAQQDVVCAVLL